MARIRTVKPETFSDEELFDAERESKLPIIRAFIGLWTQCDREGRFPWRPRMLKATVTPYDSLDFAQVLEVLAKGKWIVPYEIDGQMFAYIRTWKRHQYINNRENASELPAPTPEAVERAHTQLALPFSLDLTRDSRVEDACGTRDARVGDASEKCTSGREGKGKGKEGNRHNPLTRAVPAAAPVATLPLNDNSQYPISAEQVAHWQQLFRAVEVEHELRMMRSWLESNPTRRKTITGIGRFIHTWLSKEQNRGRPAAGATSPRAAVTRDASQIAEDRRKARERNAAV